MLVTPTFVQCVGVNEQAASSSTITASITPKSGNLLVAAVRYGGAGGGTDTCVFSDNSGSNVWTDVTAIVQNGTHTGKMGYSPSVVAGTYTVTATLSPAGTFRALIVAEYAGLRSDSPLDTSATGTATASASVTSGTFSPARDGELIVMAASYTFNDDQYTVGLIGSANGTLRVDNSNDFGLQDRVINPVETGITAKMNIPAGSTTWIGMVGAFFAGEHIVFTQPIQISGMIGRSYRGVYG